MSVAVNEMQGVLRPPQPITELVYAARGVVRLEDLDWPLFDPERPVTMEGYLGEIGARMAVQTRESSTADSALRVYRQDFDQATPANLRQGLYFLPTIPRRRPRKSVVTVEAHKYCDLDRQAHEGIVPPATGVAVSEELYEALVQNAPFFANRIANKTAKANQAEPVVEAIEDLAGESVFYALFQKHERLEEYDQELATQRRKLTAFRRSIIEPVPKRIVSLEPYRLTAVTAIQDMVRIACKGLGYGTNQTQNTLNAVASNIHRSPERRQWAQAYAGMAILYNDAVRGKVNQSIHGILGEMDQHKVHLFNNIDREYTDD